GSRLAARRRRVDGPRIFLRSRERFRPNTATRPNDDRALERGAVSSNLSLFARIIRSGRWLALRNAGRFRSYDARTRGARHIRSHCNVLLHRFGMERLENIAENNSRQARPSCDKSVRVIPREVFRAPHPGNDRNRVRAPNFLGPADDITSGPFRKGPEEKMEQGMG